MLIRVLVFVRSLTVPRGLYYDAEATPLVDDPPPDVGDRRPDG